MAECKVNCELTIIDMCSLAHKEDQLIEFLQMHNVLRRELLCELCGLKCSLDKGDQVWRCQKRTHVESDSDDEKKRATRCPFTKTLYEGTWFAGANMPLGKIIMLTTYWACLHPPRSQFLKEELSVDSRTVTDWEMYCREVCIAWCEKNRQKIGGVGVIVEIDVAEMGKGNSNKGKALEGQWVFGGYERGSNKLFVQCVANRTSETLLQCIKDWILPGTTIYSACWKEYDCLQDEGFVHMTVNHSLNFVDPDTGTHTQHIVRAWREVRSKIPTFGRKSSHYYGYLAEFLWKRSLPCHKDRLHVLFKDLIGVVYDPYSMDSHPVRERNKDNDVSESEESDDTDTSN